MTRIEVWAEMSNRRQDQRVGTYPNAASAWQAAHRTLHRQTLRRVGVTAVELHEVEETPVGQLVVAPDRLSRGPLRPRDLSPEEHFQFRFTGAARHREDQVENLDYSSTNPATTYRVRVAPEGGAAPLYSGPFQTVERALSCALFVAQQGFAPVATASGTRRVTGTVAITQRSTAFLARLTARPTTLQMIERSGGLN